MPAVTLTKPSTLISTVSSMTPSATAIQGGPYTKAQFQTTMEGSRTIKNTKEVEQLLRDYPAGLELYRTGKYKVKVKCEADFERVILVEKRTIKTTPSTATTSNEVQQNNQTVPDLEKDKQEEVKTERKSRQSPRSRTHSQDRIAPTTTTTTSTNNGNIVHTTTSSIRMTSNTQPKVDHYRSSSKERESFATPQSQHVHRHSHSRDSRHLTSHNTQQENKTRRDYPKMLVPFAPNANNPANLWQQQRSVQPYYSNPLLQQQQQQQHQQQQQQQRYMPASFIPQQNPLYRQPFFYDQRSGLPLASRKHPAYPTSSMGTVGPASLQSARNYSSSSRSVFHTTHSGLPPSFRTYHSNQRQVSAARPMYQSQVPFPMTHPWPTMANGPSGTMVNPNAIYAEQQRRGTARHRARSVDAGPHNYPPPPVRSSNPQQKQQQQQQPGKLVELYRHPTAKVAQPVENGKEPTVSSTEPTSAVGGEKLTIRQLNETFFQTDSSGRLSYSLLPALLQRFGITLTENELTTAARDLQYNVNEPISARRLVYVLVKLGKITKSTQQQQQQQQRRPASPSVLPEDREVTDILQQRKAPSTHIHSTNQPS